MMAVSYVGKYGLIISMIYLLLFWGSFSAAASPYMLDMSYAGASFFDGFDFFTDADPTNGFVTYVDQITAQSMNLISSGPNAPAYMGVDYATYITNMTLGRASVRIESKKTFTHGLIISDIAHMPGGTCGTWPAHWTLGPDWPSHGEIDIIEGVNSGIDEQFKNLMSLHTSPGCTIAGANEIGSLQSSNCDTTVQNNAGCGVLSSTTTSYGTDFNAINGGVYATEWTSNYIKIWFFARSTIPADITAGAPDPTLWGPPQANFQGSCNIDDEFGQHKIIFDTTFCGDYAGSVWTADGICNATALTCNDYVAQHPSAFQHAYWSVNSVNVYQQAMPAPISVSSISSATPQSSVLAPGMGYGNSSATSTSYDPKDTGALASVVPQNLILGYGMGGGASKITSTIISATYIDVCDICANGYSTIMTAVTFEHCGCRDSITLPTFPMTTVTKSCSYCGDSGSPAVVTVTVPYSSALQTTTAMLSTVLYNGTEIGTVTKTTTGGPAKFTGGAKAIEINVVLTFVGLILIAIS